MLAYCLFFFSNVWFPQICYYLRLAIVGFDEVANYYWYFLQAVFKAKSTSNSWADVLFTLLYLLFHRQIITEGGLQLGILFSTPHGRLRRNLADRVVEMVSLNHCKLNSYSSPQLMQLFSSRKALWNNSSFFPAESIFGGVTLFCTILTQS